VNIYSNSRFGETMITDPKQLKHIATEIRRRNLLMLMNAPLGHIGGDLSVIDILTTLYFGILDVDPANPTKPDRDRLILSKGHCAGALYTTLAQRGFIPMEELSTWVKPNSRLNGHPNRNKVPGVETNTGPLGHGLPVGAGAAKAAKIDGASWRVYVITGDGELQEGSNWEAAMFAAHNKLDNLTLIIDRNHLQQGDTTENTVDLEPLADKWTAFGWAVKEVDGHNIAEMLQVFQKLPVQLGKPTCIIAHTHKGYPISFISDQVGWHHRVPKQPEVEKALLELENIE
jgi:transketolase